MEFGSQVLTLSDVVARLNDRAGALESDERLDRMLVRAARDALRDLPAQFDWKHYQRSFRLHLSANVIPELSHYVASTKIVTIDPTATKIWPSDAALGDCVISRIRYKVSKRLSDTQLLLSDGPATNLDGKIEWNRAQSYPCRAQIALDVGGVITANH